MANFTIVNPNPTAVPDVGATSAQINAYWSGTITDLSVRLFDLTHTYPDDLDLLLVAPNTTANLLFLSDAGGIDDISGLSPVFQDGSLANVPDSGPFISGYYYPTNYGSTETDTQFGSATGGIHFAGPDGGWTFASAFGGLSVAGLWTLFAADDEVGDTGTFGAWGLTFTTSTNDTAVAGTAGADTFTLTDTGAATGSFHLTGQNQVDFFNLDHVLFEGGEGSDTFVINPGDQDFTVDGGAAFDTLWLTDAATYSFDLTARTLISIERITFADPGGGGSALAAVLAAQIGPGLLSSTATILGTNYDDVYDVFNVIMDASTAVDLRLMSFLGFGLSSFPTNPDHVGIYGDGDAEAIFGSGVRDVATAEGGNDIVDGFDGDDALHGGLGNDWLYGNSGVDALFGDGGVDWFAFDGAVANGDTVDGFGADDFLFFANVSGPQAVFNSGPDVVVGGVTVVGGAAANVNVVTQSTGAMFAASPGAIGSLLSGGLSQLDNVAGAFTHYTYDTDSNETFNVIEDYYTATGLLDLRWTFNDAGNPVYAVVLDYDQANANAWTSLTNYYSGPGDIDYRWTHNDAGGLHVSNFTDFDQASANTWDSKINYYTAPGVLDVQWTFNDAGQTHAQLFTDWDQASANAWTYRINYYTAPGVLDYQWTYNDAGNPIHSFNTDWDQTSVATWNYRITYYSAPNVADYQWTYNDAGNPVHSIMHDWDQTGAATWTTRTTYYSALNVADYQWTYHDAGQPYHSTYVDWDQANAQPWAYHVINYSAPGVVANDYYV